MSLLMMPTMPMPIARHLAESRQLLVDVFHIGTVVAHEDHEKPLVAHAVRHSVATPAAASRLKSGAMVREHG